MTDSFWFRFGAIWLAVGLLFLAIAAYVASKAVRSGMQNESSLTLLVIFGFLGGFLSLAGGAIVLVDVRCRRTKQRLLDAGVPAAAIVADVVAMNLLVNGRTQWRLKYDYHDQQNRPHRGTVYLSADEARQWTAGDTGTVLFDPQHPGTAVWVGKREEKVS